MLWIVYCTCRAKDEQGDAESSRERTLVGEVLAALGHTPAEDVAATDGTLASEEAVLALALPLRGLVLCAPCSEADGELVEGRRGSEGRCGCGEQLGEW